MTRISSLALLGAGLLALPSAFSCARADEIRHPTAIFAGLDKITGRIISFDVAIDETVQFGTLQITPRICLTRPQTEAPLTDTFVEVDEIETNKQAKRIFSGWMFAASPGLHGVEHPVYDVWLKDCKGGTQIIRSPVAGPDVSAPPPANAAPPSGPPKKPRRTITPQNPVDPTVESLPPSGDPMLNEPPVERPAAPPIQRPSAAPPADLGPPVEVGAGPGSAPAAPAPRPPKPPKPKRPPQPAGLAPLYPPAAPPPASRQERLAPMTPNDLPRDSFR